MKKVLIVFLVAGVIVLVSGCNLSGDRGNVGPDVYAGGACVNSSDVFVPGYWKNGTWNGLPPLDATKYARVFSLVVDGTDVYAGGRSINSSDVFVPGYWKNGTWNGLPHSMQRNMHMYILSW